MLVGYNTNVTYKGTVYHIQTEDSGIKNPVIITLLYLKGTILSSKKISYAQFAGSHDYKEKVRELMKEQHKNMIRELISGKLTGESPPAPKEEPEPVRPKDTEETKEDAAGSTHTVKSLDDILIDYIIKRED